MTTVQAPRERPRGSFLADLASTSLFQAVSLVANMATLAVVSRQMGEDALGLYTLERRGMALLQPIILIGMAVAVPRYVARSLGERSSTHRSYVVAGMTIVATTGVLVALVTILAPERVSAIAFGDSQHVSLSMALGVFALVMGLFQIEYTAFRGYNRTRAANLLELAVVGCIPLGLAIAMPSGITEFMWALNAAIAATIVLFPIACWVLLRPSVRATRERLTWSELRRASRELLHFGPPRIPGEFAIVALFSFGPLAVAHWQGATEAGYTSIVYSTLSMVCVAAAPLGVLLLPRAARDAAREGTLPTRTYTLLADGVLDLSLALSAGTLLAMPLLIGLIYPDAPEMLVIAGEVAALGVPFYVFYLTFRSVLDAVDTRPLSGIITMGSLAVLVVALAAVSQTSLPAVVGASAALAVALLVLGALTAWFLRSRVPGVVRWRAATPALAWFLAVAVVGVTLRDASVPTLLAAVVGAAASWIALMVVTRREWFTIVRSRAAGALARRATDT